MMKDKIAVTMDPLSLSLSLSQIHFSCDQNKESATKKKKERFPERIGRPQKGKYLGLLTQPPGLTAHPRTARGRFRAAFGSRREMVSQHADGIGSGLHLKTCLLPQECLR